MAYLHLSPGFAGHAKLLSLKPAERWKWLTVLCLCARFRCGDVTAAQLCRLSISPRLLARLLELRLLELREDRLDTYHVHDWERHNA